MVCAQTRNLKAFNMTLPWYKRLPASTALESWMLGTHPVALIGGRTWATKLQGAFLFLDGILGHSFDPTSYKT